MFPNAALVPLPCVFGLLSAVPISTWLQPIFSAQFLTMVA